MKLEQLMSILLEKVPLEVSVADIEVPEPAELFSIDLHNSIADAIIGACLQSGLSARGAYAFGEWIAEMMTGWSTRYGNETDVLELDRTFNIAAFGDAKTTIRCYCAPSWEAFFEHLPQTQLGILAAFKRAKELN